MTIKNTPTPRTDEHLDLYLHPQKKKNVHQNWADFTRQLERELAVKGGKNV